MVRSRLCKHFHGAWKLPLRSSNNNITILWHEKYNGLKKWASSIISTFLNRKILVVNQTKVCFYIECSSKELKPIVLIRKRSNSVVKVMSSCELFFFVIMAYKLSKALPPLSKSRSIMTNRGTYQSPFFIAPKAFSDIMTHILTLNYTSSEIQKRILHGLETPSSKQ